MRQRSIVSMNIANAYFQYDFGNSGFKDISKWEITLINMDNARGEYKFDQHLECNGVWSYLTPQRQFHGQFCGENTKVGNIDINKPISSCK